MNVKWVGALALVLSAGAANASVDGRDKLFDVETRGIDSRVKEAIEKVEKDCTYSMFSRIGPRPGEVAKCNKAEERAVSMGPAAARQALIRIDAEHGPHSASRWRLYDVVARVGDLSVVETLIKGLETTELRGIGFERRYEAQQIAYTLRTLTYADPKGTPAIQWRAWFEAHKGQTRGELLAERTDQARKQAAGIDFEQATTSAYFLAMQPTTRREGVSALEKIMERELTPPQKSRIQSLLRQVPKAPAQLADLDARS
jgi:hypothetical protein